MMNSRLAVLVLGAIVFFGTITRVHAQIPPSFFGMSLDNGLVNAQPWPIDSWCEIPVSGCDGFGGIRLWDSGVSWAAINQAPGFYEWRFLDIWMNHAKDNGNDILYTFGDTPAWASSNPTDQYCADIPPFSGGTCDPPDDLNQDGTGTDQHWKDFVTAIATRAAGRIHYWEVWNEASNNGAVNGRRQIGQGRWVGTNSQMLRMASDAYMIIKSIDPTAVILAPSGAITPIGLRWLDKYYSQGGGKYADALAFHGYLQGIDQQNNGPVPEVFVPTVNAYKSVLAKYKLSGKPLFDTEGSWGLTANTGLTDPEEQAGFVARFLMLHRKMGVSRLYWYQWDNIAAGTLWNGTLTPAGVAYQAVYNWLVGSSMIASSCKGPIPTPPNYPKGVWTCNFTGPNGYQAQAVWDTSRTCSKGTCTYSNYMYPSSYSRYVTLSCQILPLTGGTVKIGYQPILLQNFDTNPPTCP